MQIIILILLAVAVFGKWALIALVFPFQVLAVPYEKKPAALNKVMAIPYKIWNGFLFRGGWERWMLHEVSRIPSHHLRRFFYSSLGLKAGRSVVFHYRTELRSPSSIQIGKGSQIGDHAILDGRRGLIIGENVNLSSNVSVWTLQHDYREPDFSCRPEGGKVVIGNRAWLGCNVIVLPGVTIGEGAVCCAGCVVTKDVEPFSVVAGIPAKKINERPRDLTYNFNDKVCRLL